MHRLAKQFLSKYQKACVVIDVLVNTAKNLMLSRLCTDNLQQLIQDV